MDHIKKDGDQAKSSLRSIPFNQEKKGKSQSGIKNVQCYNCQKYGHFAKDRRGKKGPRSYGKPNKEAHMA